MLVPALLLAIVSAGAPCVAPTPGDRTPCAPREGWCFDLSIGGQAVVALEDPALREQVSRVTGDAVCWMLPAASAPTLVAVATANALTPKGPGVLYDELEIVLTGLEGQLVPTRRGIRRDPTVRVGGVPMETAVDVIDTDHLPPGRYVATFRVRGDSGWDRKAVYLEVRSP
jgi:hypothetical protein